MSLDLMTVQGFVTGTRALLLDKIKPYRYSDSAILAGLNLAFLEGARLRPDLFTNYKGCIDIPEYDQVTGEPVPLERVFRLAFEYGIAAHVLLRDEEDVQDARANTFLQRFQDMLVGVRQTPVAGGTPTPGKVGGSSKSSQQGDN